MISPVPSDSLRVFLEKATSRYQESLKQSQAAGHYLERLRGLKWETVRKFRLGFVADPFPGHEHVQGWISIPYLTPDGSVVSIRFRRLGDQGGGSKYLSIAGDLPRVFNTPVLDEGFRTGICICEGEFDAMIASQCGLPAVAVPGANAWQKRWHRLFTQYNVVYILHDDDEPGKDLAFRIAETLDNARPVPMTGGDVTTFVFEYGSDALMKKVGVK